MTNSHYGSSFVISSLIYVALGVSLYSFLEPPIEPIKIPEQSIKISIVSPIQPKKIKPAPLVPKKKSLKSKPKSKKVVRKSKPKLKPKKITKKIIRNSVKKHLSKPKPQPKKVIKKTKPVQKEFFTPQVKEMIEEPYYEPQRIAPPPPSPVVTQPVHQPTVDKGAKRREFLRALRSRIVRNKKYPPTARRRHIEGSVEVMFDIGTNGSISNIQFLNGKRILQKSVRRAVLNSSPLSVPHELQSELPIYGISVVVHFNLQ